MIKFLFGISITINIIESIILLFIYKHSLKSTKEKVEDLLIKNFVNDDINIMEMRSYDHK